MHRSGTAAVAEVAEAAVAEEDVQIEFMSWSAYQSADKFR